MLLKVRTFFFAKHFSPSSPSFSQSLHSSKNANNSPPNVFAMQVYNIGLSLNLDLLLMKKIHKHMKCPSCDSLTFRFSKILVFANKAHNFGQFVIA